MKSREFNIKVLTGKVTFRNNSYINCRLVAKRKLDSEGNIVVKGYEVTHVNSYYENGKLVETSEGKHNKQRKTPTATQLDLFNK